jgi:hypothetical protein
VQDSVAILLASCVYTTQLKIAVNAISSPFCLFKSVNFKYIRSSSIRVGQNVQIQTNFHIVEIGTFISIFISFLLLTIVWGLSVAWLVQAPNHKPEGGGFVS